MPDFPLGGGRLETITVPPNLGRLDLFIGPAELMSSGRVGTGYAWDLERTYQQQYKVFTRHKLVGPNGCCYCPGLPLGGAPYVSPFGIESDPDALACKFEAKMMLDDEGAWDVWIVTVTFSTTVPEGGIPEYPDETDTVYPPGMAGGPVAAGLPRRIGAQTRPDLVAPGIEWDEEVIHRAPPEDLGISNPNLGPPLPDPLGETPRPPIPFWNAANVPISPAPVFEYPYNVLIVARNEIGFSRSEMLSYMMAYNSDTFLDAPPGCAQVISIRPKLHFYGRTAYHRVTYRIRFAPEIYIPVEPWEPSFDRSYTQTRRMTWADIESKFLNAGTHELWQDLGLAAVVGGFVLAKRWRAIRDSAGQPVNTPVPLYGKNPSSGAGKEGTAIPLHLLQDPALKEHKPNNIRFRVRPFKPFSALFYRGLQLPTNKLSAPVGPATTDKYWLTAPPS